MSSIYSADYQRVLAILKQARVERRVTQVALAKALERPHSFVPKYESGERRLDIVEFVRIAELLDIDLVGVMEALKTDAVPLEASRKYGYRQKG